MEDVKRQKTEYDEKRERGMKNKERRTEKGETEKQKRRMKNRYAG